MRKNSGFTTYELMMTIAIMAVIAAISMPPYLRWYRSSRLRSAVSNVTADLEMAKTEAVRANAFVVIEFYPAMYKIFVDSNKDWGSGGEKVLLTRALPPTVNFDIASLSLPVVNDKVRFNSRGLPADIVTPQTIKITQAGKDQQITINRLGNFNVQ
ncbi:MAG: GspH/FimT family pseudopilin [Desulfobacterales bacterium]|jgi:prepilin-type N-terminal cleavage/methylation domain-containing protein